MNSSHLAPAIIVPLVVWRIYRRMRRNVGRQPLRRGRMIASIVIFGALSVLFGAAALQHPPTLAGLAGGLLAGALFSLYGLRLTRFEETSDGHFYTPNAYIGVTLTLLLVARMVYRFTIIFTTSPEMLTPDQQAFGSPLTLFVFGLTAGYYIAYYAGLLRRVQRRL